MKEFFHPKIYQTYPFTFITGFFVVIATMVFIPNPGISGVGYVFATLTIWALTCFLLERRIMKKPYRPVLMYCWDVVSMTLVMIVAAYIGKNIFHL